MEKQDNVIVHPSLLCPRCKAVIMHKTQVFNSLSRCTRGIDDKHVYVCNPCGMDESLEEYDADQTLTLMSDWPIEYRTNQAFIDTVRVGEQILN